jgi:preprotein translocase subunit SecG
MSGIRIAVTVIYIVVCIALVFLVFKGKGQGADLSGGIAGRSVETYYSTHGKKHTEDAMLERATVIAAAIFLVLSLILNMNWGY